MIRVTREYVVDTRGRDDKGRPVNTTTIDQAPVGHGLERDRIRWYWSLVSSHVVERNDDVHLVCVWRDYGWAKYILAFVVAAAICLSAIHYGK